MAVNKALFNYNFLIRNINYLQNNTKGTSSHFNQRILIAQVYGECSGAWVVFFTEKFGSQWQKDEKKLWEQVETGKYEPEPVILDTFRSTSKSIPRKVICAKTHLLTHYDSIGQIRKIAGLFIVSMERLRLIFKKLQIANISFKKGLFFINLIVSFL